MLEGSQISCPESSYVPVPALSATFSSKARANAFNESKRKLTIYQTKINSLLRFRKVHLLRQLVAFYSGFIALRVCFITFLTIV